MATALRRRYEAREVSTLSDTEAAWLAGVIDGEGHIKIETLRRSYGEYRYVRILVVNTSRPLLEHIEEITQTGRIHKRQRRSMNHKQGYVWQACGTRANDVLAQVIPWLIIKYDTAIDAFVWLEGGALSSPRSS